MMSESQTIKKTLLLLTQEEMDLIDLWRLENRFTSRTAAIRALIGRGCRDYFSEDEDDRGTTLIDVQDEAPSVSG
ncbi:hypothetical protein GCM10011342_06990 [Aquisalinus flavus]|uniref:Uncharacterized protein n=2 Tax=Aquisalinus flavus TaxID=1526572 RepID=A0A8J2V2H9_9PROT|nr:hypothetical protein GCM10011342_06990 [Aquisalinus flavus]